MFGYYDSGSFFTLYLHFFFFSSVSMYYNENADLSDGEDDEFLPLDTEVGSDYDQENQSVDDQENQAVDNLENQAVDDQGNQAVDDQGNQAVDEQENQVVDDQENQADATTTTASSVEEDRPVFGPHRKLSRGQDLFEFRKEVEMVKEKKKLYVLWNFFLICLWSVVEHQGVIRSLRSSIILWGPLLLLLPSVKLGTFSSLHHLGR